MPDGVFARSICLEYSPVSVLYARDDTLMVSDNLGYVRAYSFTLAFPATLTEAMDAELTDSGFDVAALR